MTKPNTKFKPGRSGNPKGRPKGSGLPAKLRHAIAADAPDIVQALINQAKAGDVQAARVLLDRIVPTLKAEAQAVEVRGLASGSLAERARAALNAAAGGRLAPDTAAGLVSAVGTLARVVEVDELAARVTALESRHEND
jgi:hypothetical protein